MNTIYTREIRWFSNAPLHPVEKWIDKHSPRGFSIASRTDLYLIPALIKSMGIKLREGKLEIKTRLGKGDLIDLSTNISGMEEQYQKWSYEVSESDIRDQEHWLPVLKYRKGVVLDQDFNPHKIGTLMDSGCQIELTRLLIESNEFHTMAFEWFGNKQIHLSSDIINGIFKNLTLHPSDSKGYDQFLLEQVNHIGKA